MDKDYINKLIMYQKKIDSCHIDNYLIIEEIKTVGEQINALQERIKELGIKRDSIHHERIGWMLMWDEATSVLEKDKAKKRYNVLKKREDDYNSQLIRLHDEWDRLDDKILHLKCIEVSHEFSSQKELDIIYNQLFKDTDNIPLEVSVNDYLEELFRLIPYSKEDVDISLKLDLDVDTRLYEKIYHKKINNKKELIKAIRNIYHVNDDRDEIPMVLRVNLKNKEVIAVEWFVTFTKKQKDDKSLLDHLEYDDCELVINDLDNINIQTTLDLLHNSNNQFRYGMVSNNALLSAYLKQYQKDKTFKKK